MSKELIESIEREVLAWDGVFRKRDEDGIGGTGIIGYRYGDPEKGGRNSGTSTMTDAPI